MQNYQKTYSRINWKNFPNVSTPINETNLNRLDYSTDELDNRIITLDVTKLDVSDANGLVKSVTVDPQTGVITVTHMNDTKETYDTALEKIAVNFSYDKSRQVLVLTYPDGKTQDVDLSALITENEFVNSNTIGFSVTSGGTVSATILENSITEDYLEPNYLSKIKVEAASAKQSEDNAKESEVLSHSNAVLSESYAKGGTGTREDEDTDNAKYYMEKARDIVGGDYIPINQKGAPDGVATLDISGKVPLTQLPDISGKQIKKDEIGYYFLDDDLDDVTIMNLALNDLSDSTETIVSLDDKDYEASNVNKGDPINPNNYTYEIK